MTLYLYDVSSMYLSYMGKSPTVHVPVLYPLYHYNFIHTHTVVVYAYHMRMTAKAVNTLELVHNCINAADSYNRTQSCNHNCTKYDFTHVRIKHSYVQPLVYVQGVTVTHVTRQTYKCTSCPYYILRTL